MSDKCYNCEEILRLKGTEEHLQACPLCRDLFAQSKVFLQGLEPQLKALRPILATAEREKDLKCIDGALDSIAEQERLPYILAREGVTPGMVISLCNRSKKHLFKSPNESERWLHLAEKVLELVKQQGTFMPNDMQWVEAKYITGMDNLFMARGFIKKAHETYLKAQQLFLDIGDEFQAANVSRALLFTMTKMGKGIDGKRVFLDALAIFRQYGSKKEYLHTMNNGAMTLCALEQRKRAERILRILIKALNTDDEYYFMILHNIALVQMEDGDYDTAVRTVESMTELTRKMQLKLEEARAYIIAGEIQILQKEFVKATKSLEKAKTMLLGSGCDLDAALINVFNAKIQLSSGKSAESIQSLQEAISFFSAEGFASDLINALDLWEKALKLSSEDLPAIAETAFHKARNIDRLKPEMVAIAH